MTLPSANDNHSARRVRAAIVAETLLRIAENVAPVSYVQIVEHVSAATDLSKEAASFEVQGVVFSFVMMGVIASPQYDDDQREMRFGADTVLSPGDYLERFVSQGWPTAPGDVEGLI